MKTFFLTLAAVALAFSASAQITNGVKVSALTSATTPLSGSEIVPMNQSGTTKTATVSQIILAATSQAAAASNYLAAVSATNAANLTTASNSLSLRLGTNGATITTTSNALAAFIVGTSNNVTTASNALAATFGQYYQTSNPAGYQTAAQVTAAASAAVTTYASTGITNSGNATLANVFYTVRDLGSNFSGAISLDLSAASLQSVTITNGAASYLYPSNIAAGQNVTVIIKNASGNTRSVYYPSNCIQLNGSASVNSFTVNNGKTAIVNLTSGGTTADKIICSSSVQQN